MSRHERENKLESTTPSIHIRALSRDKLIKETVNELHDLGIVDFDDEEKAELVDRGPTINPRRILTIIKACKEKAHREVEIAAEMIGEDTISCDQAEAIINTFHYDSIHPAPFLLEILPQISDPENLEKLATRVFRYPNKIKKFMHTVKVCFPKGYQTPMPKAKEDPLPEVVTIVKQLSPRARYALLSIPFLLVTNLTTLGVLVWVLW